MISGTEPNRATEGDHPTNARNDNVSHSPSTVALHTSAPGNATAVPKADAETAISSLSPKLNAEITNKQLNNESITGSPISNEDSIMTDSTPTLTEPKPSTSHGHHEPHYIKRPGMRGMNQASSIPSLDMNRIRRLGRNRSFVTTEAGSISDAAVHVGFPIVVDEESSEQYSTRRVSGELSFHDRCKEFFTTDPSWPWIHQIKSQNRLNVYCSYVIIGSGYGFRIVNDADIVEKARLRLDHDTIVDADIVKFTADSLGEKYFTKGFRADCVFSVRAYDPEKIIFTLEEHLCNISIPTPTTTPVQSLPSSPLPRSTASVRPLIAVQFSKSIGDETPKPTLPGIPNPSLARPLSTQAQNLGLKITSVGTQTPSVASTTSTKALEPSLKKQTTEFSALTSTPEKS